MIKSEQGTVQLSKPDYGLASQLNIEPSDADILIEVALRADLTAILAAFIARYGLNKALDFWYDAVAVYVENEKRKGDTSQ